jgi:hypothetical protein
VLTIISLVDLVGGAVFTGTGFASWGTSGYFGLIVGPTMLGEGLILSFIGPPLWVAGARKASAKTTDKRASSRSEPPPESELRLGANGDRLTLTLSF